MNMDKVNWAEDYQGEFSCPECGQIGMRCNGEENGKRRFKCSVCKKTANQYYDLKDNHWLIRLESYGLACPNPACNARQIVLRQIRHGKKNFQCLICKARSAESTDLTITNLSRYSQKTLPVKSFCFEDDIWDLRAINTAINNQRGRYLVYFTEIQQSWFKIKVKKFVYHLCKFNKPFCTIDRNLTSFRDFSTYLKTKNINNITAINRNLILNFIVHTQTGKDGIIHRLRSLRQLFTIGNSLDWFQIDPDIIRDSDYPKKNISNPDAIPDVVREQIEQNLHKLPDSIARMWIICFFTAMRPSELALLKKDCLVQQGDKWSIVWERSKGKSFHQHSVPTTRTIARVVQEQQAYIEDLWENTWEHLFCHYHNFSTSDPTHPRLKPVKRVIPQYPTPLQIALETLIKAENILDDNSQLAKFQTRLIRPTRLTKLFHKGHDLAVVSAWAGHKQLATTANFYIEVNCQQIALLNIEGKKLNYESMPKSFWENPTAHELSLSGTHVNTPIYGYCGLPLDEDCDKFRACYTCRCFVPKPEKLPLYIQQRDELREKESQALEEGHDVLIEQFGRQASQLDKIIASLQEAA